MIRPRRRSVARSRPLAEGCNSPKARCASARLRTCKEGETMAQPSAGRSLPQRRPAVLANMRAPQASARATHCMHVRRAFHRRFGPGRLDVADVGGPQLRPAKARNSCECVRSASCDPSAEASGGSEIPRRTARNALPPSSAKRIDPEKVQPRPPLAKQSAACSFSSAAPHLLAAFLLHLPRLKGSMSFHP